MNTEYQNLLSEIDRQADNIGLGATNSSNLKNLSVYIGGGQNSSTNSSVNVDLAGSGVGTVALGIGETNVLTNAAVAIGGGAAIPATAIANADTAAFTFTTAANTATAPTTTITITGQTGDTVQSQINELNADLQTQGLGITASLNSAGALQFQSASAFSVSGVAGAANNLVTTGTAETANNTGLNNATITPATVGAGTGTDVQIVVGGNTVDANIGALGANATQGQADAINQALQAAGVTSVTALVDLTSAGTPTLVCRALRPSLSPPISPQLPARTPPRRRRKWFTTSKRAVRDQCHCRCD